MSWVLWMGNPHSCKRAFRNISAACWQWKQIWSLRGFLPRSSFRAASRSSSAFASHSAVAFFIEHLAPRHDFLHEPVSHAQALVQKPGGPHQEVHGKARFDPFVRQRFLDADGLLYLVRR